MAGEPIIAKLTRAPGNNAPIGGLKVVARSGWFAARPSGTEAVYKIYAESFKDEAHLDAIVDEARSDGECRSLGLGRTGHRERTSGMMDRGRAIISRRFRRNTAPPAYCCTSPRCPRRTASAILGPALGPGSTGWPMPAKAGGNHCHSVRRDMATRPISRFLPLPATSC